MQSIVDATLVFGAGLMVGWNVDAAADFAKRLFEGLSKVFKRLRDYAGL